MTPRRNRALPILLLLVVAACFASATAEAQPGPALGPGPVLPSAQSPQPGALVGSQRVTGATWDFDGDIAVNDFPLTLVTVTNTSCSAPYEPGTAQAGAIILTASLSMTSAGTDPTAVWQGFLRAFTGTAAYGHVRLVGSPVTLTIDVDVTIFGLEDFALNNVLSVCLTGSGASASAATIGIDSPSTIS